MAIIYSYPTLSTVKATDLLLISAVDIEGNPTRTATINSVLSLLPGGSGGSGISSIQSTNTNYLSVTDSSGPIVTLGLNVGVVTDGGSSLATTGDIYDFTESYVQNFITNGGYTSNLGTVTEVLASSSLAALSLKVTSFTSTPNITLSVNGTPNNSQFLRGDGAWAIPGGTGAMTSWNVSADNSTVATVTDGETVSIQGAGGKITTSVDLSQVVSISHNLQTVTESSSTSAPGASGTFDAIDSITFDATGHLTGFNTTEITLPAAGGGGGSGTVTSVGLDVTGINFLSVSPSTINSNGIFDIDATGNASQYVLGDGTLALISDIVGSYTWTIGDGTNTSAIANTNTLQIVSGTSINTSLDPATNILTISNTSTNLGTVVSIDGDDNGFIDYTGPTSPITTSGTLTYNLNAAGTPNINSFLRGDNNWAVLTNGDGIDPILNTDTGGVYESKISVEYTGEKSVITSPKEWTTLSLDAPSMSDTLIINDIKETPKEVFEIEIKDLLKAGGNIPTAFSIDFNGTTPVIKNTGNIDSDTQGLGTFNLSYNSTTLYLRVSLALSGRTLGTDYMVTATVEPLINPTGTPYFKNCAVLNRTPTSFDLAWSKSAGTGVDSPALTNLIIYK